MALVQYTAKVKGSRLLELPTEAAELDLKPGDKVTVKLSRRDTNAAVGVPDGRKCPSVLGKYAFVAGGADEFASEKQAEIECEDRFLA